MFIYRYYLFIISLILLQSCDDIVTLENGNSLRVIKDENGLILDSLTYNKDNQLTGLAKFTDKENFTIYTNYINGVKHGLQTTYHPNGELYNEGYFTNGKKWREWKQFRENGMMEFYKAYTPKEELIYMKAYNDKGKVEYTKGDAFMFYSRDPKDSILYVGDTLLANIYISYPPNCILKARTLLSTPNDSIVSVKEYTFNKTFIGIQESFDMPGIYTMETYWILKDTLENKIEKGIDTNTFKVRISDHVSEAGYALVAGGSQ